MAKNDNPNAIRLIDSLRKHDGDEAADAFEAKHQLSKSASVEKKFEWAQEACEFLTEKYDDETVKLIRIDCACGPVLSQGKKLKELHDNEPYPAAFVKRVNALDQGFSLDYDGQCFYLIYPQCYCSCVKRIDKTLPKAWCYCTLGYTKRMFEYILGKEVHAELVSSVKMGDENCRIKISV